MNLLKWVVGQMDLSLLRHFAFLSDDYQNQILVNIMRRFFFPSNKFYEF